MRPSTTSLAAGTIGVLMLTTTGCGGSDADSSDGPTSSPAPVSSTAAANSPPQVTAPYRKISGPLRKRFGFFAATPADLKKWEPSYGSDNGVFGVHDRAFLGCDSAPPITTTVDRSVRDFAEALSDGPEGLLVARQVTTYSTVPQAAAFAKQWRATGDRCSYLGGPNTGFEHSDLMGSGLKLITTRFPTLYEDGRVFAGKHSLYYVDVITRRGNAVALTRVVDPHYSGKGVLGAAVTPANRAMLSTIEAAAARSARTLAALS